MENGDPTRFQDSNFRIGDFTDQIIVHCPKCDGRAEIFTEMQRAHPQNGGGLRYHRELRCSACFLVERRVTHIFGSWLRRDGLETEFQTPLWLRVEFGDEVFWACNYEHLDYLKRYIGAKLRERRDRRFATMVEKLPAFMKSAKNRTALLKVIEKLSGKVE